MAILFYDDISLDRQEIQNVALQSFETSALDALSGASELYQGRIAYDTDLNSLVFYNGSAWVYLDGTGNIDSITGSGGIDAGGSNQVGDVTISVDYTSASNIILSTPSTDTAVTSASKVLVSVGQAVESHSLSTLKGVMNAGVASITGSSASTYITNTASVPDEYGSVTILSTLGSSSSTAGYYFNGLGNWVQAPSNENTTYAFEVPSAGIMRLNPSGAGSNTDVTLTGTANEIEVTTNTSGNTFTLGFPTNVTVPGTLKVAGVATFANNTTLSGDLSIAGDIDVEGQATFDNIPVIPAGTPPNATSAASKKYVDDVVSGGLVFKGPYNATTDAGDLEDPANGGVGVGILTGYTYVVTVAGTGAGNVTWTPALDVGDIIICNTDTPENETQWSPVQTAIDPATASAAGTAMFPAGNGFAAPTASGAVSLTDHSELAPAATYGSSTTMPRFTTNTFGVVIAAQNTTIQIPTTQVTGFATAVDSQIDANSNIYTIDGDGSEDEFANTNTTGSDLATVQVYQTAPVGEAGKTVYPRITRTAGVITVNFKSPPAADEAFKVLVIGNTV